CTDARVARTDRAGGRFPQEFVHPIRLAAQPVSTACRGNRRITVMNHRQDLATDTIPLGEISHEEISGLGAGGAELLGRVAAPPNKESTSDCFYFWVQRGQLVERGQVVTTTSSLGGRTVEFIGLVEEVYRQSRQRDMGEEADRFDGVA